MPNSELLANPLEAWTQCATSLVDTSMAMTLQAANTTLSMWGNVLAPASSTATPAPAAMRAEPRPEPRPESRPESRPEPVTRTPERPASWYRAPYRSPFDPMFWLEPDTSHSPFPAPYSGAPWLAGMPAMPAPFAWPGLGGQMQPGKLLMGAFTGPFAAGAMPFAQLPGTGLTISPWMTAGAWQPLVAAWMSMMTQRPSLPPALTVPMLDPMAFSSYRSAGGFAVAQAFMDTAIKASQPQSSPANPWMQLAFPWLRR